MLGAPRAARRPPRQRLDSIKAPPRPSAQRRLPDEASTQPARQVQTLKTKPDCCEKMSIVLDDDGKGTCENCGTLSSDGSDLRSDTQFVENSVGGATVQGGFVGKDQRFANTMGGTVRGLGGRESREQTEQRGRDEIRNICAALRIGNDQVKGTAEDAYKLALNDNFVQGRRVRNVAAVVIYYACRRNNYQIMLIDLAEQIRVNVWQLGDTYKQYLKAIMEDGNNLPGHQAEVYNHRLMEKYCQRLEFGDYHMKVAEDALRLLKRMDRDWMSQGRQPAGLFGACIILASRMHGFRRSVREVVYIVRVADSTVNQRLLEFKRTETSRLTVAQHQKYIEGTVLPVNIMPPSVYRREEKEERLSGDADSSEASALRRSTRKKRKTPDGAVPISEPRRDEDGFAVPDVPANCTSSGTSTKAINTNTTIDPDVLVDADGDAHMEYLAASIATAEPENDGDFIVPLPKKKRGRPPKVREPIVIREEELEVEADIKAEIERILDSRDYVQRFTSFETNDDHVDLVWARRRAKELAEQQRSLANARDGAVDEEDGEEIGDGAYESDEDVRTCILSEPEVRQKERVWLTDNEDWLRAQQQKILAKALEEAQGKPKKEKLKRNVSRMGDGSVLGDKPAANTKEAVEKMLKKRSTYSNAIDYDMLNRLFPDRRAGTSSASASGDASLAGSPPAPSTDGAKQRPAEAVVVEDDGEEDEEEEEEEQEEEEEEEDYGEEEEIPPHMLLSDDEDEGFGEIDDDF
ncbi:hypothetical protein P154DRAFT_207085 [Amniculicola lignicola CBS 123094]|uniref:Cyclin-like domain-containing protein n=1 Tax=Amniculicola lignicola CBS 123094 TaxID=1392246 RepID=A0A6A5WIQ8_9PLEO|nr:hypothetical protein P154DRAFT_207085 [Amniculicola lignicola CBS 123094]